MRKKGAGDAIGVQDVAQIGASTATVQTMLAHVRQNTGEATFP